MFVLYKLPTDLALTALDFVNIDEACRIKPTSADMLALAQKSLQTGRQVAVLSLFDMRTMRRKHVPSLLRNFSTACPRIQCFKWQGSLFWSNEAHDKTAKMLIFNAKTDQDTMNQIQLTYIATLPSAEHLTSLSFHYDETISDALSDLDPAQAFPCLRELHVKPQTIIYAEDIPDKSVELLHPLREWAHVRSLCLELEVMFGLICDLSTGGSAVQGIDTVASQLGALANLKDFTLRFHGRRNLEYFDQFLQQIASKLPGALSSVRFILPIELKPDEEVVQQMEVYFEMARRFPGMEMRVLPSSVKEASEITFVSIMQDQQVSNVSASLPYIHRN